MLKKLIKACNKQTKKANRICDDFDKLQAKILQQAEMESPVKRK